MQHPVTSFRNRPTILSSLSGTALMQHDATHLTALHLLHEMLQPVKQKGKLTMPELQEASGFQV